MLLHNYFDNAATTPVDPRVVERVIPFLQDNWGNPHSLHEPGSKAMAAIQFAREQVALLIGAEDPAEIVFTSGATESNNWILHSFPGAAVSPFEHSSIDETAKRLGLAVLSNRGLNLDPQRATLISVHKVNNELGTVFHPEGITGGLVHTDATQAVGKVLFRAADVDFASFSGHKFYSLKGSGGLYARSGHFPEPFVAGGEQEHGMRAGTLNVPGIVAMGAAAEIASNEWEEDAVLARELRGIVLDTLDNSLDFQVNGGAEVSPYILSISFYGIEGETVVIEMDRLGFAISSGAACSSRSTSPSHVLTALGLEPEWLRGTLRISFGRFNTRESAHDLAKNLNNTVQSLSKFKA